MTATDPLACACDWARALSSARDGQEVQCHHCGGYVRAPALELVDVPSVVPSPAPTLRVWRPSAAADMRLVAEYAPAEVLRAVDPEPRDAGRRTDAPPDPVGHAIARGQSVWQQRVDAILDRLTTPALRVPRGLEARALAQGGARCEACATPGGAPWHPPPTVRNQPDRATRRARLGATRIRTWPRPAGLADVLVFAFAYHQGPLELAPEHVGRELERHVAWHFAPEAQRRHWRVLGSRVLRESELLALGITLIDCAIQAYDDLSRADAMGAEVAALTTPWVSPGR